MRRVGFILLGLALLLVVGRIAIGSLRAPDDQALVRQALTEATKAAREGRPGGVLDYLASDASLNGQQAPDLSGLASRIRKYSPDITLNSTAATITGDEARVITPAQMSLGILAQRTTVPLGEITVTLKREDDRDFLIIPTHRWRVTRVEVPAAEGLAQIARMAGFGE